MPADPTTPSPGAVGEREAETVERLARELADYTDAEWAAVPDATRALYRRYARIAYEFLRPGLRWEGDATPLPPGVETTEDGDYVVVGGEDCLALAQVVAAIAHDGEGVRALSRGDATPTGRPPHVVCPWHDIRLDFNNKVFSCPACIPAAATNVPAPRGTVVEDEGGEE